MATSPLQQKANDVRANRVNWQSYLQYVHVLIQSNSEISSFIVSVKG